MKFDGFFSLQYRIQRALSQLPLWKVLKDYLVKNLWIYIRKISLHPVDKHCCHIEPRRLTFRRGGRANRCKKTFIHNTFYVCFCYVFICHFYFKHARKMACTYYMKQQIKMTSFFVTVYNLQQYVLQFGCNSLCALRFYSRPTAAQEYYFPLKSQMPRYLGNSG